jgi:hypothetical protein
MGMLPGRDGVGRVRRPGTVRGRGHVDAHGRVYVYVYG